ncbi:hemicentin-1-like [Mytilus californianus]|uniref:hemicentin-1-like n=1 Tax=Mytilus californianus TaxID=6549 RepID=UPI0022465365|nr:hemicentin-1-like [Mytilus californianus]
MYEAPSDTISLTENPKGPINTGETLHVTCSVSGGNPLATITWNCSGTTVKKSFDKVALLNISFTVGKQDDGVRCTCYASHIIATYNATAEKVIIIEVYYPPDSQPTIQQIIPGPVDSGSSVSLNYSLSGGNPLASLSWDCKGTTHNSSSSTKTEYIVTFTVNKNFDGRVCTCSATHPIDSYRPIAQHQLIVFYEPGEPKLILGEGFPWFVGNTITVNCSADAGNPWEAVYKWMIGGQILMENKCIIQIGPMSFEHNKQELGCSVNNNYTLRNDITLKPAFLKLNIEYYPEIKFDRFPVYAIEGKNTSITCNTHGNPLSNTQWVTNGIEMTQQQQNQSVLYLSDINRLDEKKNYTCRAISNSSKYGILTTNKDLSIVVFYNTSVTKLEILNGSTFSENQRAILRCQVTGNPLPNVTWYFISNETKTILQRQDGIVDSSYTINTTNCLHTGIYECSTQNTVHWTKVTNSKQSELYVTCAPRLDNRYRNLQAIVTADIGTDLNLTIFIVAYPPPEIRWVFTNTIKYKNFKRTTRTYTSTMYINNISSSDLGIYTMHAYNNKGDLFIHSSVSEKGTPTAPIDINIICKAKSLHILWVSEFNGGREQTFFVEYWISQKAKNVTKSGPIVDLGKSKTVKYVVKGILPGTNYSVRISASNFKGRSVSETMNCITDFELNFKIKQDASNGFVYTGIAMLSISTTLIVAISIIFFIRFKKNALKSIRNSTNDKSSGQERHDSLESFAQDGVEETTTESTPNIGDTGTDMDNDLVAHSYESLRQENGDTELDYVNRPGLCRNVDEHKYEDFTPQRTDTADIRCDQRNATNDDSSTLLSSGFSEIVEQNREDTESFLNIGSSETDMDMDSAAHRYESLQQRYDASELYEVNRPGISRNIVNVGGDEHKCEDLTPSRTDLQNEMNDTTRREIYENTDFVK